MSENIKITNPEEGNLGPTEIKLKLPINRMVSGQEILAEEIEIEEAEAPIVLSKERLALWAQNHQPPKEWLDSDEEDLFS